MLPLDEYTQQAGDGQRYMSRAAIAAQSLSWQQSAQDRIAEAQPSC